MKHRHGEWEGNLKIDEYKSDGDNLKEVEGEKGKMKQRKTNLDKMLVNRGNKLKNKTKARGRKP